MSMELRPKVPSRRHLGLPATAVAIVIVLAVLVLRPTPSAKPPPFTVEVVGTEDIDLDELDHPVDPTLRADQSERAARAALVGQPTDVSSRPFVPGLAHPTSDLLDLTVLWRPASPYRIFDRSTAAANIADRARRSWSPPTCACPTVRVWMYGGSTTYGTNQRDEHTIASYLAKTAWAEGVRLEVSNRGQLGFLHWMEAERFALDLTVQEPPDLVVFYDGVNDGWATNVMAILGVEDIHAPIDPTLFDAWRSVRPTDSPAPSGPPGARLIGYRAQAPGTVREEAELVVARYDRSRQVSRSVAEHHRIAIRYAWQPSRYSRDLVESEPHADGRSENRSRLSDQVMRDALPADVINLVDVLDGNTDPLFTDDVHHNEEAARIIAGQLYLELEQDLRRLATEAGR